MCVCACKCVCLARGKACDLFRTWLCLVPQRVCIFVCSISLTQRGSGGSVVRACERKNKKQLKNAEGTAGVTVCFLSSVVTLSLTVTAQHERDDAPCVHV